MENERENVDDIYVHAYNFLKEKCGNCGRNYGAHHGGTRPWPANYCSGPKGKMDWDNGPGTVFKPTGRYEED